MADHTDLMGNILSRGKTNNTIPEHNHGAADNKETQATVRQMTTTTCNKCNPQWQSGY